MRCKASLIRPMLVGALLAFTLAATPACEGEPKADDAPDSLETAVADLPDEGDAAGLEVQANETLEAPPEIVDASVDTSLDLAPEPEPEVTEVDAQPEVTTVEPLPPAEVCPWLGLPVRAFVDGPDDPALHALAADFTVETRAGSWNLRERWSGCESYLFIQDLPQQLMGSAWPYQLWERDLDWFLTRLPLNTQVFFVPTSPEVAGVDSALALIEGQLEAFLAVRSPEEVARWQQRLHLVTETSFAIPGWLGATFNNPNWGVGIDRAQRVRYIGSYADVLRYNPDFSWPFEPNLSMAANEAIYYEFEAAREAALAEAEASAAGGVTKIPLWVNEAPSSGWSGTKHLKTVTLPDAAAMAAFDTLELDMSTTCGGQGELGYCPEWDRIISLHLCDSPGTEEEPASCPHELGRWITTYHREGRWVHDVSGLLPLLAPGGETTFAYHSVDAWTIDLTLRLATQGKATRPSEAHSLFGGSGFGPNHNQGYEPKTIPIPADAKRVLLAHAITGHGMALPETDNCAEFCTTTHSFFVGGEEHVVEYKEPGQSLACMQAVPQGTVPNQYGTWWLGRNGWCPGREVPLTLIDVTVDATPGEGLTVAYMGLYKGAPFTADGASIAMSSWLLIEK